MHRIEHRVALRSLLELLAVTGLAVTQPLLDVFGKAPEAFVGHDAGAAEVVLFALVVALVPAGVLWGVEMAVRAVDPEAGRLVHIILVASLVGLFAIQALKDLELAGGVLLALLGVAAAGLAVAAYRHRSVRLWLAVLAVGPAVFLASFLVTSPASDLLRSDSVGAADVEATGQARSVVMIVWDEWPLNSIVNADGEIDADLFPNLAALAGDGAWYRNATTVATATTAAVPAILSGRYAQDGASPTAADHPENLFTLLASQYDLEVSESVTAMCPQSLCSDPFVDDPNASASARAAAEAEASTQENALSGLLDDALATYRSMISLDPDAAAPQSIQEGVTAVTDTATTATSAPAGGDAVDEAVAEARSQESGAAGFPVFQIDSFESLVSSIEADEDPALHFLHLQLPHTPYRYLPDGRSYDAAAFGPGVGDIAGSRGPEAAEAAVDRQRLLLQVGYVDRLVGQVVDRLKQTGLYDDTVIVMTSDHGTGFVPGESHRGLDSGDDLSEALYPDILYVPLIIKAPGLEPGTVSDDNVLSIDLLPTIADTLGIEVPWSVDGRSLLGPARTDPEKQFNKVNLGGGGGAGGFGGFGGGVSLAETQTFDGDEALARNLARNIDTLLVGDNPDHRVYAITADGDLVGTPVDDLGRTEASGTTLVIDGGLDALEAYTTDDAVVPVHLTGAVEGGPSGDLVLAIAVDGVIAAVVPTFPDADQPHHVDAMVDPSTLTGAAPHDVQAFLITGRGTDRQAAPVAT